MYLIRQFFFLLLFTIVYEVGVTKATLGIEIQ